MSRIESKRSGQRISSWSTTVERSGGYIRWISDPIEPHSSLRVALQNPLPLWSSILQTLEEQLFTTQSTSNSLCPSGMLLVLYVQQDDWLYARPVNVFSAIVISFLTTGVFFLHPSNNYLLVRNRKSLRSPRMQFLLLSFEVISPLPIIKFLANNQQAHHPSNSHRLLSWF